MANVLKMALMESILSLQALRYSQRRIARELGVDRETVGKYLRERLSATMLRMVPEPAIAPTGSGGSKPGTFPGAPAPGPKPASNLPTGSPLVERACEHYNARKRSRHPDATPRSEPAFLHRICVNYLRHELTSYHAGLRALGGRAGDQRALAGLRTVFLHAIAAAYPVLLAACAEARRRRSDLVEVLIPERRNGPSHRRAVYRR